MTLGAAPRRAVQGNGQGRGGAGGGYGRGGTGQYPGRPGQRRRSLRGPDWPRSPTRARWPSWFLPRWTWYSWLRRPTARHGLGAGTTYRCSWRPGGTSRPWSSTRSPSDWPAIARRSRRYLPCADQPVALSDGCRRPRRRPRWPRWCRTPGRLRWWSRWSWTARRQQASAQQEAEQRRARGTDPVDVHPVARARARR